MTIQVQAIYKAGAIVLPEPLAIAEGTAIDVTIVPTTSPVAVEPQSEMGRSMAEILNRLATLKERSVDDVGIWQQESRSDRSLPGRG